MIQRNVHHNGKNPSRTCIAKHCVWVNKWSAAFETWASAPGGEFRIASCTSGALFDSEEAAYAAADRALDVLQATGKYPNMCEAF